MKSIKIFLATNLLVISAISQNSFDTLDVNNIKAGFNASGDLFYNINTSGTPIFAPGNPIGFSAGNLWIGGYDNYGVLHVSAQTYRQSGSDFWPGPLDTITAYCPVPVSNNYNYVWNLACSEVDSFITYTQSQAPPGFTVPLDLQTWPGSGSVVNSQQQFLAPFMDVDGDQAYDFAAGDYPLIRGNQSLFYVYNDSLQGNSHTETGSVSLGLQIKAMPFAYAYNWDEALMNTIFIHYTITNYKTLTYYGTRIGLWYDIDFNAPNGKDASDSLNQLAYRYTTDDAFGIYFLTDTMSGCIHYDNNFSPTGNPSTPFDYYEYLNQSWSPTEHLTYGGSGYMTGAPTNWMYTGNPVAGTGWNDNTAVTDHRTVMTLDSFTLYPGMTKEFVVAFSFAHDTSNYAAIGKLYQYVNQVRQFYAGNNGFCSPQLNDVEDSNSSGYNFYPNPTTDIIQIDGATFGQYQIYSASGSLIRTGNSDGTNAINIADIPPGIYFLQLTTSKETTTTRFVKSE